MENRQADPKISVVMPTYNGEEFIAEAIQSILEQTFKDFELIVVDDGSTDKTAGIIQSFKDPRIRFIKNEKNSGIADSLNKGIEISRGMYFARMDDDDTCHQDRLKEQFKFLEENARVVVCATNDQNLGGERPYLNDSQIKVGLIFRNVMIHASTMIPMDIIKKYKYSLNKVPSEDYDLWSRIMHEGLFHKLEAPLMQIRYAVDGQTATRRKEQLQLNVEISMDILKSYGFKLNKSEENLLSNFSRYNYDAITPRVLVKILAWLESLKYQNAKLKALPIKEFDNEIEFQKFNFLKKYFLNKKWYKKIIPFFYLKYPDKIWIFNYYLKKIVE